MMSHNFSSVVWSVSSLAVEPLDLGPVIGGYVAAFLMGYEQIAIAAALMGAIILVKHRANIRRLLAGEEPKIGAKA